MDALQCGSFLVNFRYREFYDETHAFGSRGVCGVQFNIVLFLLSVLVADGDENSQGYRPNTECDDS